MPDAKNLSFWRALRNALAVTFRHAGENPLTRNWLTAAVIAAIVITFAFDAGPWLAYRRSAVDAGEWWRLVTPLFVHASRDHLAWNVITMSAAGIVAERVGRRRYGCTILFSAAVIGLATHIGMPAVHSFIGASGTAAAVFTLILLRLSVLNWRVDPWVTIVSCIILAVWGAYEAGLWGQRTPWEAFTGSSVRGVQGRQAIPFHLIGMLAALPIALWPMPRASDTPPSFNRPETVL